MAEHLVSGPLETDPDELSERREALASFAYRFHSWEQDDRRWGYLASLWSLLDTAASADAPDQPMSRDTRLASAVLSLIDGVDDLISCGDSTKASSVGLVLRSSKIVETETFAILAEAGARYAEALR